MARLQPWPGPTRITEVDPGSDPRWDEFVNSHPEGLVYHHSAWLAALERESGVRPFGLVHENGDGRILGVLPLLATRGLPLYRRGQLTGRRLSSLPRTPLAGPLAVGRDSVAALVAAAVDRVRAQPDATLQLKVHGAGLDGLVDGLEGVPWSHTYVLPLPPSVDDLRFGNSRNDARIRWAVGKAERLGVRVREADSEDELRVWHRLYLETMRWHAMPPRTYRFFAALWELLRPRGLMELLLAEHEGALVAGSIFLHAGGTFTYAFNGRRREELALRPNDVIMSKAIHDACRRGFRRVDLGETGEHDEGLIAFKRKWGAEQSWLYRYYFPATRRHEPFAVGAGGSQLTTAVWRRLPIGATVLVSRAVYRYL